jgi:hypothetical protein
MSSIAIQAFFALSTRAIAPHEQPQPVENLWKTCGKLPKIWGKTCGKPVENFLTL